MIKEIITNLKDEVDNIVFRMDSGYENEEIAGVIEQAGYQYVIKAMEYTRLLEMVYGRPFKTLKDYDYKLKAGEVFLVEVKQMKQSEEVCNCQGIKTGKRQEST